MKEIEYKNTNISIYDKDEEALEKYRKQGWTISDKIVPGIDVKNKETFVFVVEREKHKYN